MKLKIMIEKRVDERNTVCYSIIPVHEMKYSNAGCKFFEN